jgi:hypothetical protein
MSMAKGLAGHDQHLTVMAAVRTMAPKTTATKCVDANALGDEAGYSPMTTNEC